MVDTKISDKKILNALGEMLAKKEKITVYRIAKKSGLAYNTVNNKLKIKEL